MRISAGLPYTNIYVVIVIMKSRNTEEGKDLLFFVLAVILLNWIFSTFSLCLLFFSVIYFSFICILQILFGFLDFFGFLGDRNNLSCFLIYLYYYVSLSVYSVTLFLFSVRINLCWTDKICIWMCRLSVNTAVLTFRLFKHNHIAYCLGLFVFLVSSSQLFQKTSWPFFSIYIKNCDLALVLCIKYIKFIFIPKAGNHKQKNQVVGSRNL